MLPGADDCDNNVAGTLAPPCLSDDADSADDAASLSSPRDATPADAAMELLLDPLLMTTKRYIY